ncbi:MAG: hypothetical protein JSS27_19580 [Planctomycetes bacterium]|nr:hypothetical protein [Planctomycetota bacterium]
MLQRILDNRATWTAAGLIAGLALSFAWSPRNLQAVATDRGENFALSTGTCDDTTEAVFTLDFLTGDLNGAVVHPVTKGLAAIMHHNVLKDLKIEAGKQPKLLMVTARADLRPFNGVQMGQCILCIAELNSGMMALYGFPYSPAVTNNRTGTPLRMDFIPLQVTNIRNTQVRGQ